MGRHGSVFIALATSPDTTADDGRLDGSPYAKRLIEAFSTQPNDPLSLLFDDLDARVYSDTDQAQAPEYLNGLARAPRWSIALGVPTRPVVASVPLSKAVAIPPFLSHLDRARLLDFTRGNVTFTDTLFSRLDLLAAARVDTPLRLAYFLATAAFESNFFRTRYENLNYSSASRLMQIFPQTVQGKDLASYVGHPERIANLIYASKIGNGDEASGDGWRYRGRGLFMLSGRTNYAHYGDSVGVDLIAAPDLLNDPETDLAVALSFWSAREANSPADGDDLAAVTRRIIGQPLALPARQAILNRAKQAVAPQ